LEELSCVFSSPENDPALGTLLERGFDGEHYLVDLTSDGERTRSLVEEREYDLAILDLNVPYPSGLEVLQQRRARHRQLPILVLTEPNRVEDRVRVLRSTPDRPNRTSESREDS